jgi:energy-coupling factor transport system ATP-binding protein
MLIDLQNLTYTYPGGRQPALRDLSLQIGAGEFVLLAGPSGAGKSTLLRCLNGLTPHFSGGTIAGRLRVAGYDPVAAGPQALSQLVGFVFQDPESQTVLDQVEPEIAFALENAAIPPNEMRLRVEEALNLLDLAGLRERPLTHLSGGERQRVAIAAALALRPRILAVDEPTSQLDPQSAEDVLQALARLNEDLGLTIVLVEHRLERALRYVDRLIYMEGGRILVDAPPTEALAAMPYPQTPPLARLGRSLNWAPLPLTIKEGLRFAAPPVSAPPVPARPKPPAAPPLLSAEGLRFSYDGVPVLRDAALQVYPGEAVALMGRNGSGKSTLLKCLVGLLRPSHGTILLNGRNAQDQDVAEICRQIAYLPQHSDDLLFADTVAEELAITLQNHGLQPGRAVGGLDEPYAPYQPQELLGYLGLTAVADAYPRDLSVGQRQRVALGAVMVTAPRLWLLDEPTRGLDYQAKQDLIAIWRRWRAQGAGLLLVTHDVELAAQIADRTVIISEGEIIADGATADLLPASPLFAPQVSRLFPGSGWLTVENALEGLHSQS